MLLGVKEKSIISIWIDGESKLLESILGDNQENYHNFINLQKL
ncbi:MULTISPECIES: hypothetical protein [Okeania]|nr:MULTISPECIES: hypothetical protein [Okeania]